MPGKHISRFAAAAFATSLLSSVSFAQTPPQTQAPTAPAVPRAPTAPEPGYSATRTSFGHPSFEGV